MKIHYLLALLLLVPIVSATPFDYKWDVCSNYLNLSGASCDVWWSLADTTDNVGNYTILNDTTFFINRTEFENFINQTNHSIGNITFNTTNFYNKTEVNDLLTSLELNSSVVNNLIDNKIATEINSSGKILNMVRNEISKTTFKQETPTLTLINFGILVILILVIVYSIMPKRNKDGGGYSPKEFRS